jgi:NADPH:quinone reductase-like Zn-dependent oxidoreductase
MPQAVRFNGYGDVNVLEIAEIPRPQPAPNQVIVKVMAASINPGESKIREGAMKETFPATFPSGEGTDFAGVVDEMGSDIQGLKVGDEVVGYTHDRASHAQFVAVPTSNLVPKPRNVSWEVAGSLWVAGTTAYAAVKAVNAGPTDTVVVSAAGGGVGVIASQLAKLAGAKVIGVANEKYHPWLTSHGIVPVSYHGDIATMIKAIAHKVDAFIDTSGHGYVKIAIEMGIAPDRIDTIADFAAVGQYHVKADGSAAGSSIAVLKDLVELVADAKLDIPIARTFPLSEVKEAYRYLESKHDIGKVVLLP